MAETTVYLEIEPQWSRWTNSNGDRNLTGIRVVRTLQKRPTRMSGVVVALNLRLPDAAFKPLQPKVVVDVPETALAYEPVITVEMPPTDDDDA